MSYVLYIIRVTICACVIHKCLELCVTHLEELGPLSTDSESEWCLLSRTDAFPCPWDVETWKKLSKLWFRPNQWRWRTVTSKLECRWDQYWKYECGMCIPLAYGNVSVKQSARHTSAMD